jgi:rfaE bifunctional protein nucleotidyltransferase chain/domain
MDRDARDRRERRKHRTRPEPQWDVRGLKFDVPKTSNRDPASVSLVPPVSPSRSSRQSCLSRVAILLGMQSLSIRAHSRYDAVMSVKVMTRDQLAPLLQQARTQGKRIVFTNGCFDLMHIGHTRYLQAAKALGDVLVVGVNSDASVRSLNKAPDRPIVSDAQRAEVVAALGCIDYVILFNEPDPQSLIAALQPDVLVKGGDWAVEWIIGREIVEARGGVVRTIPLVPGVSTTT